jgi:hypothetical protein
MDEVSILHALKDLGIELRDLHTRINAIEKRLEKGETVVDICTHEGCCCENVKDDI